MRGAEFVGPSPHDGRVFTVPNDVVALVLVSDTPGSPLRVEYTELRGAEVDRQVVAEALFGIAEQLSGGDH